MPDEDKTFSGSFVLDLRIWSWCQAHTLYNKIFINVSSCRLLNVVKAKKKNLCHFPACVKKALERKKPGQKGFKNIWSELGWCVSWLMTKVPALSRKVACTVEGGHLPFSSKHSFLGTCTAESGNSIISNQSVTHWSPLHVRCLPGCSFIVYHIS